MLATTVAVAAAVRPDLQLQKLVADHFGETAPSIRLAPSKTQTVKVSAHASKDACICAVCELTALRVVSWMLVPNSCSQLRFPLLQAAPRFSLLSLTRLHMTANASGAASSKSLQKIGRAAAATVTDADTKNKAAQSARDPPEAATLSGEEPHPSRSLKVRAANVYNAEWTPHEQAALDQAAVKFPAERYQPFERYIRIAATLPRKGVRDVALRLRWLSQARKRKVSEDGPNKRLRRDRCQSIFATQQKPPNMMPQWPQQMPMPQLDDHGATTVGAVGGLVAQLLEQNLHILYQYKQNMHQFKVQENTELLVRFRDNILAVLNQMSSMDGVMSQMPQLPVRMNVELANNFLPAASGTSSMFSMGAPHMGTPGMNPIMGMPNAIPGMTSAVPGMSPAPGVSSVPRMGHSQGIGTGMPVAPMSGTSYMGGQHPPDLGSQPSLGMGAMSAGMPGMSMQSMPLQSTSMQSIAVHSMQSMGSAAMPAGSMPITSHAQHPTQNGAVSTVTGGFYWACLICVHFFLFCGF